MERILQFGPSGKLNGILNHEEGSRSPVILCANAGVISRVGPFRLWVKLCRTAAEEGFTSFRFDVGGLGDSDGVPAGIDSRDQVIGDYVKAMDAVEAELGKREFILVGLCSGAETIHAAAVRDPRVRDAVMIDGYGYRTKKYYVNHTLQRATSIRRWKNRIARGARPGGSDLNKEIRDVGWEVRQFPPQERVEREIEDLLRDGRRLYYIFTAGVPKYYNYRDQFWDMFPSVRPVRNLRVDFWETSDHTFALVTEREKLIRDILNFAEGRRAAEGAPGLRSELCASKEPGEPRVNAPQ